MLTGSSSSSTHCSTQEPGIDPRQQQEILFFKAAGAVRGGGSLTEVKEPEVRSKTLISMFVEVKNGWRYTSTPPRAFMT